MSQAILAKRNHPHLLLPIKAHMSKRYEERPLLDSSSNGGEQERFPFINNNQTSSSGYQLTDIPLEVIQTVLCSFLGQSSWFRLASCNHYFHHAVHSSEFWNERRFNFPILSHDTNYMSFVRNMRSSHLHLTRLALIDGYHISNEARMDLLQWVLQWPSVKNSLVDLKLYSKHVLSTVQLISQQTCLKTLRSLEIQGDFGDMKRDRWNWDTTAHQNDDDSTFLAFEMGANEQALSPKYLHQLLSPFPNASHLFFFYEPIIGEHFHSIVDIRSMNTGLVDSTPISLVPSMKNVKINLCDRMHASQLLLLLNSFPNMTHFSCNCGIRRVVELRPNSVVPYCNEIDFEMRYAEMSLVAWVFLVLVLPNARVLVERSRLSRPIGNQLIPLSECIQYVLTIVRVEGPYLYDLNILMDYCDRSQVDFKNIELPEGNTYYRWVRALSKLKVFV